MLSTSWELDVQWIDETISQEKEQPLELRDDSTLSIRDRIRNVFWCDIF